MLTTLGGIESEVTITRMSEDSYYLLASAVAELHDFDWLCQHIEPSQNVEVKNVTDDYGVLVLTGPFARHVLDKLTNSGLRNEDGFKWMTYQKINVAGVPVRALRVSYAGELGWELHHPMHQMQELPHGLM